MALNMLLKLFAAFCSIALISSTKKDEVPNKTDWQSMEQRGFCLENCVINPRSYKTLKSFSWNVGRRIYCWWKKSCTSWCGRYPCIYRVLYISTGAWGFSINRSLCWIPYCKLYLSKPTGDRCTVTNVASKKGGSRPVKFAKNCSGYTGGTLWKSEDNLPQKVVKIIY